MAWYVESLILDRERVRASFTNRVTIELDDLDDPRFNDLLSTERIIEKLYDNKEIDAVDIEVLQTLSDGNSLVAMAHHYSVDVNELIRRFFTTCNKISYELQGHFTDAGYIKYMSNKHKLDEQQTKKMIRYINKSRRTRIRRLTNDKSTY